MQWFLPNDDVFDKWSPEKKIYELKVRHRDKSSRKEKVMAWVPPALRKQPPKHVVGANVGKIQEWFKKNMRLVLALGVVTGLLIAVWLYNRRRGLNILGSSATEADKVATEVPAPVPVSSDVPAPVAAPAPVPAVVATPPLTCADGLPKPANVYQDDGLSGVNDVTLGPGVAAYTAGNVGMPVDYAGSCSGVNPAAVWQSSQLLPAACGQSLEGTSDWNIYAPSNYQVTSFLAAGQNFGQDTVSTTLRNASLDIRPEPAIPQAGCSQVPFGQSSWVDNGVNRVDYSHSLVA